MAFQDAFLFFLFWDKVYVAQTQLEFLITLPSSVSQVLGLQVSDTQWASFPNVFY
jgi:hypothetical protein